MSAQLPRAPIHEALLELIENASQAAAAAHQNGGAAIAITAKRDKAGFRITVDDNGAGVAQEVRDDLFKRAASTRGSIGMGLILVRQLLHLIQGDLELERSSGEGARFVISVPVKTS